MRLKITEILEYYEVPQLFIAMDAIGTSYLCLTYDVDAKGVLKCLSADISKDRLNDFITGHLDLRSIFLEPELFVYDVEVKGEEVEAKKRDEDLEDTMLPDEGYFLNFAQRENYEMICASREERRTIIRLAFNHETNNHTLPVDVMTKSLHDFQAIISKAYHKLYKNVDENYANLNVRAAIAASFDLEFVSNEETDLLGGSKIADTLGMIQPLFSDNDDDVADCLVFFKNAQSNYKSLVKTLSENSVSFKCKWVDSSLELKVSECPVSTNRMIGLYSLASSLEQMEDTTETFEGYFFMANTRSGDWKIKTNVGSRPKSGKCYERSLLNGIILYDQMYRVTWAVHPSRNPNTGREYRAYVLMSVERLYDLMNH